MAIVIDEGGGGRFGGGLGGSRIPSLLAVLDLTMTLTVIVMYGVFLIDGHACRFWTHKTKIPDEHDAVKMKMPL